jgi:hypothetical protein
MSSSAGMFSVDSLDVCERISRKKESKQDSSMMKFTDDELETLDLEHWTATNIKQNYTLAFEGSYSSTSTEDGSPSPVDSQAGLGKARSDAF